MNDAERQTVKVGDTVTVNCGFWPGTKGIVVEVSETRAKVKRTVWPVGEIVVWVQGKHIGASETTE